MEFGNYSTSKLAIVTRKWWKLMLCIGLRRRPRHSVLLLKMPRNQGVSKKYTKPSDKFVCSWASSSVDIVECFQL